jgi:GNAT superfamily N-acetyltransferase
VTPAELLAVYDEQVRASMPHRLPPGWSAEQDGPLLRCLTPRAGFAMLTAPADGLGAEELAALVDRTVAHFADHGRWFEWKTFDHDRADLPPLLLAAGAKPQAHEALVLGEAAPLADEPVLPADLVMREITERMDLERVAAMESEVWGEDWSWLADDLADRLAGADPVRVLVVEDGDRVVSAAWLAPLGETSVAGLWGGSTLAAFRGRGIYRALVARRARLALDLGFRYLQVDASDDSRPILQRLGLTVVGGTTPYVIGDGSAV